MERPTKASSETQEEDDTFENLRRCMLHILGAGLKSSPIKNQQSF